MNQLDLSEDNFKPHYSGWMLTINSNQTADNLSMREFKRTVLNFFRDYFGGEGRVFRHRFHKYDESMRISVNPVFETGPHLHRLHCHALVKVFHSSNIHLDRDVLDEALPGWYKHFDLLEDSTAEINRVLWYMRKQFAEVYEQMDAQRAESGI